VMAHASSLVRLADGKMAEAGDPEAKSHDIAPASTGGASP